MMGEQTRSMFESGNRCVEERESRWEKENVKTGLRDQLIIETKSK
jgi:hypothetical protein